MVRLLRLFAACPDWIWIALVWRLGFHAVRLILVGRGKAAKIRSEWCP